LGLTLQTRELANISNNLLSFFELRECKLFLILLNPKNAWHLFWYVCHF